MHIICIDENMIGFVVCSLLATFISILMIKLENYFFYRLDKIKSCII